ncbi:MAG: DUF1015 family protein [Planctomycetota bacterium]|nr:DUF1015 family protein [Planctomycetota bacterium]
MALIRPFRALHPQPEQAARVASVPYDVVDTEEARALAAGNPDSFLHVTRPEIDLPADADPHADAVYAKGRDSLADFRERGVLAPDSTACLYLYRLTWQGQSQTGIVAAYSVEEYDQDRIKKHEFTRPDKEEDRTVHMLTLGAQPGPVFLTFRPDAGVRQLMAEAMQAEPWIDFTAPDEVQHTLWRLDRPEALVDAFRVVDPLYVADGHHRSASASNARRRLGAEGELPEDHPAHGFLGVAFPSDEVRILPYNRLVGDLAGKSPEAFLAALREAVSVSDAEDGTSSGPTDVRMYLGGAWYRLDLEPDDDDPVERLATQMLQRRVLGPLLAIEDQRTDPRIRFVGGIRGTGELVRRVDAGEATVAFSFDAVTPDELLAVADAGRTMPPKSTWFEPKLRSGLFTYLLEEPR